MFEENLAREMKWLYEVIVFEKLRFHLYAKLTFLNSSGLKNVFEKLSFRDGLVWGVGLAVEIKAAFSNFSDQVFHAAGKFTQ